MGYLYKNSKQPDYRRLGNMNSYLILKSIHVFCVALSASGFVIRGIWMLSDSIMLQQKLVRFLPHIIDSCLLVSAIALAYLLRFSPLEQPWLMAKILALFVYILFGSVALKRGKTKAIRLGAFIGALVALVYIVLVALTKSATVGIQVAGILNF